MRPSPSHPTHAALPGDQASGHAHHALRTSTRFVRAALCAHSCAEAGNWWFFFKFSATKDVLLRLFVCRKIIKCFNTDSHNGCPTSHHCLSPDCKMKQTWRKDEAGISEGLAGICLLRKGPNLSIVVKSIRRNRYLHAQSWRRIQHNWPQQAYTGYRNISNCLILN